MWRVNADDRAGGGTGDEGARGARQRAGWYQITIIGGEGHRFSFQDDGGPASSHRWTSRWTKAGVWIAAGSLLLSAAAYVGTKLLPADRSHPTGPYVSADPTADLFWCASTQDLCAYDTVAHVPKGVPVSVVCWRDDRQPFPNSSSKWFYVFLDNGQEGFLWEPQVANQPLNTPSCDAVNWINVADWAIGRIGLRQWRSRQADGPFAPRRAGHYWSGWPLAFASDAWKAAGGDGLPAGGSADAVWNSYVRQGRAVTNGSRPPRGAMIFWSTGGHGHVAISLGNWQAVGTVGDQSRADPVRRYSVDPGDRSIGILRGWVMPPEATAPYNTR